MMARMPVLDGVERIVDVFGEHADLRVLGIFECL